jgi:signal transduction histidine kinase
MFIKIIIVITIILLIIAVIVSLRLTKRTKYNLSWVLISLGFLFLLSRRIIEALPFFSDFEPQDFRLLFIWFGIASSFFFAAGLILIRRIFDYMEKMEKEKRANEKKYLSVVISTEENERKRLANEIHDGLGPLLSSVKMSVSALKKYHNDSESGEILRNIEKITNESIKSIKDISNNLSPHVIQNFGLVKALQNFINKINSSRSVKIDFIENLKQFRPEQNTEIVLYRVVCELINNTIKHAKASNIYIQIEFDTKDINLNYKDDGIGFEVDNLFKPKEKGMGFYNIFSRINSLQGSIETFSAPGKGTSVNIRIPVKYEN